MTPSNPYGRAIRWTTLLVVGFATGYLAGVVYCV